MIQIEIREVCGDWELMIKQGTAPAAYLFCNSRLNAEQIRDILLWEDAYPNQSIPFPQNKNIADNNMSLNGVPVTEQNIKDTVSDWMDNLLLDGMEFNERDEDGDLLSYIGEMFDDDEDMFIETLLDFAAE